MGMKYTVEMVNFVKDNIAGVSYKDMTDKFNVEFGTSISVTQMSSFLKRNNIKNGRDMTFRKGHKTHNKGKKGVYYKGCEKTWFQKGHTPKNHRPVGSERISKDGYIEVKVSEPNVWTQKHKLIYELHFGQVPKGNVVVFLDGNKRNLDIGNLKMISRAELARMNQSKLFYDDAELTKTGIVVAKLLTAKGNARRR